VPATHLTAALVAAADGQLQPRPAVAAVVSRAAAATGGDAGGLLASPPASPAPSRTAGGGPVGGAALSSSAAQSGPALVGGWPLWPGGPRAPPASPPAASPTAGTAAARARSEPQPRVLQVLPPQQPSPSPQPSPLLSPLSPPSPWADAPLLSAAPPLPDGAALRGRRDVLVLALALDLPFAEQQASRGAGAGGRAGAGRAGELRDDGNVRAVCQGAGGALEPRASSRALLPSLGPAAGCEGPSPPGSREAASAQSARLLGAALAALAARELPGLAVRKVGGAAWGGWPGQCAPPAQRCAEGAGLPWAVGPGRRHCTRRAWSHVAQCLVGHVGRPACAWAMGLPLVTCLSSPASRHPDRPLGPQDPAAAAASVAAERGRAAAALAAVGEGGPGLSASAAALLAGGCGGARLVLGGADPGAGRRGRSFERGAGLHVRAA
jgi:hypothetical protein